MSRILPNHCILNDLVLRIPGTLPNFERTRNLKTVTVYERDYNPNRTDLKTKESKSKVKKESVEDSSVY